MLKHLAVIADGNGRYGEKIGLSREDGYQFGAEAIVRAVEDLVSLPIETETFYVFSTENFKRNQKEVSSIFHVIAYFLKKRIFPFAREKGISVRFIGNISGLDETIRDVLHEAPVFPIGKTVVFAINYGGDDEIARACKKTVEKGEEITAENIKKNLDTAFCSDPDAILRYGGYKRLSNFLPLQSAYSELFFIDKLWPTYDKEDIEKVLSEFTTIKRNFGK